MPAASYAVLPGLMSRQSTEQVLADRLAPPRSLLPGALALVEAERAAGHERLRRWRGATLGLAAFAAAGAVTAGLVLPTALSSTPDRAATTTAIGRPLVATRPNGPDVRAAGRLELATRPWGTQLRLSLHDLPREGTFTAYAVDAHGQLQQRRGQLTVPGQGRFQRGPGARRRFALHQPGPGELSGRHPPAPTRPRVTGGNHQQELVTGDHLAVKTLGQARPLHEAEPDRGRQHLPDDLGRVDRSQPYLGLRVLRGELDQPTREQVLRDGQARGDPQPAVPTGRQRADPGVQNGGGDQDVPGPVRHQRAGRRQRRAAGTALDQRQPDDPLHPLDPGAHVLHPVMGHFYGAPPMAMLTVGAGALLVGRDLLGQRLAVDLDWALWTAGTVTGLLSAAIVPYVAFTRHQNQPDSAFGGWLMPIVPPIVSASTGALLVPYATAGQARETLLLGCYVMFGLSLLASLVVTTLIWGRLAQHKVGAAAAVPTLWIVLGPLGQSITAAGLMGNAAQTVLPAPYGSGAAALALFYGLATWGFAILWLAIATAITVKTARQHLPFSLTWWRFTFPVGTVVTGTSALATRTHLAVFTVAAAAL